MQHIGVGEGKFLGCEGFWPEFPQTCPIDFWATFCADIFSSRSSFGMTSKKRSSCDSANVGAIFAQIFRNFAEVFTFYPDLHRYCPDFQGFCPDFQHIENFGVLLHPRLLHH